MHQNESMNFMKMAHRLDAISSVIKTNQTNSLMMDQMKILTPILQKQANLDNIQDCMRDMSKFQDVMDEMTKAGKIMDSAMNSGLSDVSTEANVDSMLNQMKMEIAHEVANDLMGDKLIDTHLVNIQNQPDLMFAPIDPSKTQLSKH